MHREGEMRNWRRAGGVLVALTLLIASSVPGQGQGRPAINVEQASAGALTEMPQGEPDVTGSFYVPAYSSVSMSQGRLRADFSVTLTIHNASESKPLVLKRVAYFDGAGKLVESYLKRPIALKPFATVEIFVPEADIRAGTGANFIVDWAAVGAIAEPVTEALMFGTVGAGHYAFISQGRAVRITGGK
jgi:Protein of unknown function (DUF3124)